MGLKIWSNVKYDDATLVLLRAGTTEHELVCVRDDETAEAFLAEADILLGQPPVELFPRAANLRWVHLDSAGYERYDHAEIRVALQQRGIAFTNSSSVFDEPCAQHVLAMMLSLARRIPQAVAEQNGARAWRYTELRAQAYLLNGQTVLLLGYGAIARRLVELLTPLRLNLIALRRQPTGHESIPIITAAALPAYLPQTDHLINILPASAATRHFVNAERLQALKPGALFYNIGRGSTVDQDALLAALQANHLAAAYLDVTDPEPLPPAHPLWAAPNCFITPHTGGGHSNERARQARHFLENLRRYAAGEALLDRIV
ncbi:MAG: D-2-hydroxyacid dehydrogenase [Acidobacteria bacterium]|nr:D-2-hydroxyacid dehydrogenase [Acidobacteriota bacterium]MBI3422492.1 D-2-hydroxyacid dehydrogenase [Acidobacteriota bacterium]